MPIPDLNEHGFLPEGIHDCTLEEIGARFGRFQSSDRRIRLFEKLRELFVEERRAGLAIEIYVDGSFTTSKTEPGDIDLVIVLPIIYNSGVDLPPFEYNAISERRIRRHYQFDVFVVREHSDAYFEKIRFYQKIRGSVMRKGLLKVKL